MSNDPTTQNNSNLAVGAVGLVSAAALSLATFGTFFHSGNLVSTQQYTTARVINGTVGIDVFTNTGSTATGGLASGNGNYQAITIPSPLSATNAPNNGLNAGTGVARYAQLDIINPGLATAGTCSIQGVSTRGTGGTILIARRTIGTGTQLTFGTATGNLFPTIGPTQSFRCSFNPAPGSNFNVKALLQVVPSQVIN